MKKLLIVCAFTLTIGFLSSPCFAIHYCKDFLEPGNPGGWSESLKTFEDEWTLNAGEIVELDIWINDVPEELITAGFWITYDPSLVSIEEVLAYNHADLPGPWSISGTQIIRDIDGPGTYWLLLHNTAGAPQDANGDILLGKIRFRRAGDGEATITISVDEIDDFESIAGLSLGNIYDDAISPNTIILHQGSQIIPTLSEWGIIIFMTLILGISVAMLYRRKLV